MTPRLAFLVCVLACSGTAYSWPQAPANAVGASPTEVPPVPAPALAPTPVPVVVPAAVPATTAAGAPAATALPEAASGVTPYTLFQAMSTAVAGGAKAAIEQRLSGALGRPVTIEALDATPGKVTLHGVSAAAANGASALKVSVIELESPTSPVARIKNLSASLGTGGRALPVRIHSGRYDFAGRALDVDSGRCELPGNPFNFSGHVESMGKGKSRFRISIPSISVAPARGKGRRAVSGGRASLDLRGTVAKGLDTLDASGSLRIDGLVVDLSGSRSVARFREQVASAGASARALDQLARGGRFARITGQLREQADFYGPVLEEASKPHTLSRVSGPVKLNGGKLTAPSLSGDDLRARVTWRFDAKRLDANVERLALGRVTLLNVGISGPVSGPAINFDRRNVRLDGKPAPTSEAMNAAAAILGQRGDRMGGAAALSILDAILRAGREAEAGDFRGAPPPQRGYRNNLERLLEEREGDD